MNYKALGLPEEHGQNAFTACVPRSTKPDAFQAPKKRGPKPSPNQRSVNSLLSQTEISERRAAQKKLAESLKPQPTRDWIGSPNAYEGRVKHAKLVGAGSPAGYSK